MTHRNPWLFSPLKPCANAQPRPASHPLDPVQFSTDLGFHPDPLQAEVLRAMADPAVKQGILNCTRQWGKSTTAAAGAAHRLVTRPGSTVVIAAPSKRQSARLARLVIRMLKKRGIRTQKDGIHEVSAVLPNDSLLIGLPCNEETARGISAVSLLLVDEAARVPDSMYEAVRPMGVTVNGDVWLMSTPWDTRGFFYDAWENGGPEWKRFTVKATDCPRIPAEWLEKERAQMPAWVFRREYMAEFVRDDLSAFDAELIEQAVADEVAPMEMDWKAYAEYRKRRQPCF